MNGAPPEWGAEHEILRLCARRELAAGAGIRLAELLSGYSDWKRLQELAARHGVLPLVSEHLTSESVEGVPTGARAAFRQHLRMSALRALAQVAELFLILDRLAEKEVRAVPYKGPALAETLYGNLGLRICFDLDLVVAMEDVAATRETLLELGYRTESPVEGPERAFLYQMGYHERFVRSEQEVVELHWGFTGRENRLPLNLHTIGDRLIEVELGGRTIPSFSAEDHLIVLCVHGAKHRWSRLELIAGAAQLIRDTPDLDWGAVMDRARRAGCRRMVLLGALVAREYGDVSLPEAVITEIERRPVIRRLADHTRELLLDEAPLRESEQRFWSLPNDLYRFRLRERLKDRVRFIAHRVAHPSQPAEWHALAVGPYLVPLHSFVRPVRVALKLIPETVRAISDRMGEPR